jgi:hypothetical protein
MRLGATTHAHSIRTKRELTPNPRLVPDVTANATDRDSHPDGMAGPRTTAPVRPAPTAEVCSEGVEFDPNANVDPHHIEPVGTTLGEPAREHWDTKQPERRDAGRAGAAESGTAPPPDPNSTS